MAASSGNEFDSWLSDKLTKLNADVDLEVFVSYIRGILEEDSPDDEKGESIEGFLAEITVSKKLIVEKRVFFPPVRTDSNWLSCLYLVMAGSN